MAESGLRRTTRNTPPRWWAVKAAILCFQGFPGFFRTAFPKALHCFASIALIFEAFSGLKKLNMETYRSGHNENDSKSFDRWWAGPWVRIPPSPPIGFWEWQLSEAFFYIRLSLIFLSRSGQEIRYALKPPKRIGQLALMPIKYKLSSSMLSRWKSFYINWQNWMPSNNPAHRSGGTSDFNRKDPPAQ